MDLDEIKKDLDNFIWELFYGFSTFVIAKMNQETMVYAKVLVQPRAGLIKDNPQAGVIDLFLETLDEYKNNTLDEQRIKALHSAILRFRSMGFIVHNPDAISSLKMEKLVLENENRKLASAYQIQSGELEAYKKFAALQGKTVTGIQ